MNKKGFTLFELVIVISLVGLLMSVAISSYSNQTRRARDARRRVDLDQIRSALELFKSNNDFYPTTARFNDLVTQGYLPANVRDPLSPARNYQYTAAASRTSPACNNTSTLCLFYTLTANLEIGTTPLRLNPNTIQ